jgi:mono/diheme cytochrome c family protein
MRYVLLTLLLLGVIVVSLAGFRGGLSRRPPIEIFPDMDRQPRLRPQEPNNFFADRFSSRLPVTGTVPQTGPTQVAGREIYPFEDVPYNTGFVTGTTNFVETLPVPVTAQLLARGQERYGIHCAQCHGAAGDGKGITSKYVMIGMANFHDKRLVAMPDGQLFYTITYGTKNLMGAYGPNVTVPDRWAIVAYVRALQRSHLGTVDDVPEPMRANLK